MDKKRFFTSGQIAGIVICILLGVACTVGLVAAQIAKAIILQKLREEENRAKAVREHFQG